jgi:hypothetical protein
MKDYGHIGGAFKATAILAEIGLYAITLFVAAAFLGFGVFLWWAWNHLSVMVS